MRGEPSLRNPSSAPPFDSVLSLKHSRHRWNELNKFARSLQETDTDTLSAVKYGSVSDGVSCPVEQEHVIDIANIANEDNVSLCNELEPLVAVRKAHPQPSEVHKLWQRHIRKRESRRMRAEALELAGNSDFLTLQAFNEHYHFAEESFHKTNLPALEAGLRAAMNKTGNPRVNCEHELEKRWLNSEFKGENDKSQNSGSYSQCLLFCCNVLDFFDI